MRFPVGDAAGGRSQPPPVDGNHHGGPARGEREHQGGGWRLRSSVAAL